MKNIYKKIAAVTFAALFFLNGCAEKPGHMEEAEAALGRGAYEEALEEFRLFIEEQEELKTKGFEDEKRKNINISEAYLGTGIAKFEQEKYEEAEDAFKAAAEYGVNTPMLYRFIGVCLMEQEKYEEALGYFTEGVRLPVEEVSEEDDEEGEEDHDKYKEAIREMRLLMIDCYEKLRDWKNADKAAQRYLEEYPDDAAVKKEEDFLKTRVKEAEDAELFLKTE